MPHQCVQRRSNLSHEGPTNSSFGNSFFFFFFFFFRCVLRRETVTAEHFRMQSRSWQGASSWGETVGVTMAEKVTNLPAPGSELLASQAAGAITRSKGFGRGTAFHPVTGEWTDPSKEAAARELKQSEGVLRGNIARDRQLRHMQSFDLLTGRPHVLEPTLPPFRATTETFSGRVPYNILSGQPLPDILLTRHASHPRLAARAQSNPPRPLFNHAPSLVRRRAVDMISGKYVENDEERTAAENAAAAERARHRFWQTRNFHPVLQRYEDPEKDAAYSEAVVQAAAAAGVAQAARLPAVMRYSQGRAYDNIGHFPKDPEVINLLDTMENRPLRRMGRLAVEERLSAEGEAEAHLAEARRMHTQRTSRVLDNFDPRGYAITTSIPTAPRAMLTGKPLSAWERIARDLSGGGGGAAAGGGGGAAPGAAGAGAAAFPAGYTAGQRSRGRQLEPLPGVGTVNYGNLPTQGLGHTTVIIGGGREGGGGGAGGRGGATGGPPPTPLRLPE
jgi:hypothetical protein